MRAAVVLAFALALASCDDVGAFYCYGDPACFVDGNQGVCVQPYEVCAFTDLMCPAPQMLRYDDSAGDLAGVCVGQEEE